MITKIGYEIAFPKEYTPENARKLDAWASNQGWWWHDPEDPNTYSDEEIYADNIDEANDIYNQQKYLDNLGINRNGFVGHVLPEGVLTAFYAGDPGLMPKEDKWPNAPEPVKFSGKGALKGAAIGAATLGGLGLLGGGKQLGKPLALALGTAGGLTGGLIGGAPGAFREAYSVRVNPEEQTNYADYQKFKKAYVPGNSWKD